ncbi:lysosomal alpha-glucosidase-like [Ixodes scapularis]|uniref:lysosomal alpha-glucosidase-like n=1 Tax=Ixodes scapularis TaxID=6945 RepID=UPI001A9FFC77|nr:lysosomal alpha-glucosidase-like [Ixodes scapularis]
MYHQTFSGSLAECQLERLSERFDCHPVVASNEDACLSRGCCWKPLNETMLNERTAIPSCYFPKDYAGYAVTRTETSTDRVTLHLERKIPSGIDVDIRAVRVELLFYDQNTLRIRTLGTTEKRFVPPVPRIPSRTFAGDRQYTVTFNETNGEIKVHRRGTPDTVIFQTHLSRLVFTEKFLQLSTLLPSDVVYGLGEQWSPLRRGVNWTRHVIFNDGAPPTVNRNMYGSHPFYIGVERDGKSHGVFLHNSNSIEVVLQPTPAATFRTIGGILDIFVFVGPTPAKVVQQYQHVVGLPALPPYWSLGFNLCRYEYGSLDRTRFIMEKNIEAQIPLDVQWNDIDYMERRNGFTYDNVSFHGLPEFVDRIHSSGRHYVMIFDPAMSGSEIPGTYPPFDMGIDMDIFVKNESGGVVYGKVWNDKSSVFPDFSHPRANEYWGSLFKRFHEVVPFDGAWIDMNEPTNFYDGHADGCPPNNTLDYSPYVPGEKPLFAQTLCMSDRHHLSAHYDVHNIYAHLEAEATYTALAAIRGKRPFIISRASSTGMGAWSGHWSGDIASSWGDMRLTIPNMLSFGMYGMPLVGSDICGFRGNSSLELCARWHVLGAFYPFSRNHNDYDCVDQDPYSMGPLVIEAARTSLRMRYSLLPYLYTLFYRSHVFGETVARPLFFEFPEDPKTHDVDEQFFWGGSLMFNPALYPNQTEVHAYIPAGVWYDIDRGTIFSQSSGTYQSFPAPFTHMNTLIWGGSIVPAQKPGLTTTESRRNPLGLLVAPDRQGLARGQMFRDDGDSINTVTKDEYDLYDFILIKNVLVVSSSKRGYREALTWGSVVVYGVTTAPHNVLTGGRAVEFRYSPEEEMLILPDVGAPLGQDFTIAWS